MKCMELVLYRVLRRVIDETGMRRWIGGINKRIVKYKLSIIIDLVNCN